MGKKGELREGERFTLYTFDQRFIPSSGKKKREGKEKYLSRGKRGIQLKGEMFSSFFPFFALR